LELSLPDRADAGMKNLLQLESCAGVGENTPGKLIAAQPAIGPDNVSTEQPLNLREGGLSRFNDLAGDDVGIDHGQSSFAQKLGGRGFTHADSAGESESLHGPSVTAQTRLHNILTIPGCLIVPGQAEEYEAHQSQDEKCWHDTTPLASTRISRA
jgi:hypothetical protein